MKVLGIDTSCDETSMAVVENGKILRNIVASQVSLHKNWGGVVPDLAKRAHEKNIDKVYQKTILGMGEIEVVAVTIGPGLAPALRVGVEFAKKLAWETNKKLVAVNHIEGHLLSPFINRKNDFSWPIMVLSVSGKHTQIVLMEAIGKYKVLGVTLDDAAGEALDKAARVIGLGYPGGPILEKLAKNGQVGFLKLPLPLKNMVGYDFSFSGLKTSFYYQLKDWQEAKKMENKENLSASFQEAVGAHLFYQLEKAIRDYQPATLFGVGGVMSNNYMRQKMRALALKYQLQVFFPISKKLNTDNAAMIAYVGEEKWKRGEEVREIERLDFVARLSL